MLRDIGSKAKAIWERMKNKEYRDAFMDAQIADTISSQIFHIRESRGWTQVELAEKAGMMQPAISRLERSANSASLNTLKKVASAFDVALLVRFVPFSRMVERLETQRLDEAIAPFQLDGLEPSLSVVASKHFSTATQVFGRKFSTEDERIPPATYKTPIVVTGAVNHLRVAQAVTTTKNGDYHGKH